MLESIGKILLSFGFKEYALFVFAIGIFVDVNPKIKLNPIKAIINYFGKWFNNSVQKEIAGFKQEVNLKFEDLQKEQKAQRETLCKLVDDMDQKEASKLRWEISDFETSILNGEKHSREQYRHIFDSANKFFRMVQSADGTSHKIKISDEDIQKIREAKDFIQSHYDENRGNQSAMLF